MIFTRENIVRVNVKQLILGSKVLTIIREMVLITITLQMASHIMATILINTQTTVYHMLGNT